MTVLTIRAHKRFAVCRKVRLRPDKGRGLDGLLIELSLDGCRISHVAAARFALGDALVLNVPGREPLPARIRWLREGTVGLRFDSPLHNACLQTLIGLCRGEPDPELRAYGT